jgi:AraC family transcriptional regulator
LIEKRLRRLDEVGERPERDYILKEITDIPKEITIMEPKIVSKSTFSVVGMQVVTKNEQGEIPQLWDKMGPRWQELKGVVNPEKYYGICGNTQEDGRFMYLAGQEVNQKSDIPAGMEITEVPEQTYAVFRCTIPTIAETYEYAFNTWLPQSDYEHVLSPDFELYDEDFHPETSQVDPLYIYIPVKHRG